MRLQRTCFLALLFLSSAFSASAQTAVLHEVHADGLKTLKEDQVVAMTGLATGSQVGRKELQDGADALVHSGMFAEVKYNFVTRGDGVAVTFHLQENPRLPVYYDNFPWFADSELNDALKKQLPFFDGTLPAAGGVIDVASDALKKLLATKDINGSVDHLVVASPFGEGSVQEFHIDGMALTIASVEFSDALLNSSPAVQQHLTEIRNKPYSRMTIDVFLNEQIRPIYLQTGYLKAKLGPPEVRLTGNPNQKIPEQIPVYIPTVPGSVYHWSGITWTGNNVLSAITLTNAMGLKNGDIANGMQIQGGLDRALDAYSHLGYLDVKLEQKITYNDTAKTVSYDVHVNEGKQFRFNAMNISGISIAGERMVREAWPLKQGDVFDKAVFDSLLTNLELHHAVVFRELPIHYDTVGHWLQTDPDKATVDVLLDFK